MRATSRARVCVLFFIIVGDGEVQLRWVGSGNGPRIRRDIDQTNGRVIDGTTEEETNQTKPDQTTQTQRWSCVVGGRPVSGSGLGCGAAPSTSVFISHHRSQNIAYS